METVVGIFGWRRDLRARISITWYTVKHESDLQKNHGDWEQLNHWNRQKKHRKKKLILYHSIDQFLSLPFVAHINTQCKPSDPHTLHGTRLLNICSRWSATNHVFWLSITMVFLKVTFVCNGVSGNGNPCAQVPPSAENAHDSFQTCLIYFFGADSVLASLKRRMASVSISIRETTFNK